MSAGLDEHLERMTVLAHQVDGLLIALNRCIGNPERAHICEALTEELNNISGELLKGLDGCAERFTANHCPALPARPFSTVSCVWPVSGFMSQNNPGTRLAPGLQCRGSERHRSGQALVVILNKLKRGRGE